MQLSYFFVKYANSLLCTKEHQAGKNLPGADCKKGQFMV